jgi:hypothetical protein
MAARVPLGRKELDRAPLPIKLLKIFEWAQNQREDYLSREGLAWSFYYASILPFTPPKAWPQSFEENYGLWGYGYAPSYSNEPGYSLSRYGLYFRNQALPFESFPTPPQARHLLARFYREEARGCYETHLFRRPGAG